MHPSIKPNMIIIKGNILRISFSQGFITFPFLWLRVIPWATLSWWACYVFPQHIDGQQQNGFQCMPSCYSPSFRFLGKTNKMNTHPSVDPLFLCKYGIRKAKPSRMKVKMKSQATNGRNIPAKDPTANNANISKRKCPNEMSGIGLLKNALILASIFSAMFNLSTPFWFWRAEGHDAHHRVRFCQLEPFYFLNPFLSYVLRYY